MTAAQKLRGFNTTVEWVVPDRAVNDEDVSAAVYGEVFERLIREGFNGIATVLYDHAMIPLINRAVDQGIPVITLNSESTSLRSMVATITGQAVKLMGMSEQLAAATVEASAATSHINSKMGDISRGTGQQNEHIKGTEADLESLLSNIDRINHEAAEGASSAENAARSVGAGTAAMDQTLSSIQSIEQSVGETWKIVKELGAHSERIDTVIELIDDIASMVNVLALNASIEATRAGEAGKGFMVVANEIRRLSKRTAEATREVTELINTVQSGIVGVQKSIEQGLDKVRQVKRDDRQGEGTAGRPARDGGFQQEPHAEDRRRHRRHAEAFAPGGGGHGERGLRQRAERLVHRGDQRGVEGTLRPVHGRRRPGPEPREHRGEPEGTARQIHRFMTAQARSERSSGRGRPARAADGIRAVLFDLGGIFVHVRMERGFTELRRAFPSLTEAALSRNLSGSRSARRL